MGPPLTSSASLRSQQAARKTLCTANASNIRSRPRTSYKSPRTTAQHGPSLRVTRHQLDPGIRQWREHWRAGMTNRRLLRRRLAPTVRLPARKLDANGNPPVNASGAVAIADGRNHRRHRRHRRQDHLGGAIKSVKPNSTVRHRRILLRLCSAFARSSVLAIEGATPCPVPTAACG